MDNNRRISMLPVLLKVFEYLEKNLFLSQNQYAFRKNRSTQHPVTYLSDYVREHMDRGEITGAIFIRLKKALDTETCLEEDNLLRLNR